jgi:NADP-reducing hydrogenase subunit HndB
MAIKSLEELRALRASLQNSVDLREKGESKEGTIEVLIGMGTCGISAGARETFNELIETLEQKDIKNVKIISVGCLGQCTLEPTVQVNIPGRKPVIYGNITKDRVDELVEKVIVKNGYLDENLIIPTFSKVEVQ